MHASVVMTGEAAWKLGAHLLRDDGQEDLCFLTWRPSTGRTRRTAILHEPVVSQPGERQVHGNASFQSEYAMRAAQVAAQRGMGLGFAHSHPLGWGWQDLNPTDRLAESRIANLGRELTGLPLVGLTLAGDRSWTGRIWGGLGREVAPRMCEAVRVVGDGLSVTFNDDLRPIPRVRSSQVRTVHTWGEETQATIARLRVAVAGAGSVGMAVAELLARTGIEHIGVFDFDSVETLNLDRLRGARALDALLIRPKTHVARRLLLEASTAEIAAHEISELSVCEPEGLERLLDYDLIFSCVDRPWPRHVLNTLAYADLIPVIEGGLIAFQNSKGSLRNAYWRSTVVRPGRPCLACLGQYDRAEVQLERDGSLDDPAYIANLPADSRLRRRENIAAFSVSVTAALMQQFVSYVAYPSGFGDPGPLRFSARDHSVERDSTQCGVECPFQASTGCGNARLDPASRHVIAERAREGRASAPLRLRVGRVLDDIMAATTKRLETTAGRWT